MYPIWRLKIWGELKIEKYRLKRKSSVSGKSEKIIIEKGTEILSDGYIDEDGGIMGTVNSGMHKGMVVIFNIDELEEIKENK